MEYHAFYACTGLTAIINLNPTPINITNEVFTGVNTNACIFTVPTSAVGLYAATNVWKDFANITGGGIVFAAKVNNSALGSVSGTTQGLYASGATISITATPAAGYSLLYWTGGSRTQVSADATLTFALTQDSVLTVHFGKVQTLNLTAAGTLKDVPDISTVSHLRLTGSIDARDVSFMRDSMPVLMVLDLEGANVVAYTGKQGTDTSTTTYPVNEMPQYSFYHPSSRIAKTALVSVKLPAGLTSIGRAAFQNCSRLTSLTLPCSLTAIGGSAFRDCRGLTSLTFPSSLTAIGGSAFQDCRGLTGVLTLPSGLTTIENESFQYCRGLTSLTLPSGLTAIGRSAFGGCGLTSLTLPSSLTVIGEGAFQNCRSLTSITNLSPTPQVITRDVFHDVTKSACELKVPDAASVLLYQAANVWKDFFQVMSYEL
jgi:hypothetical protein